MITVILFEESTIYGKFYRPINEYARNIASLIGVSRIPEDRLPYLKSMGYRLEIQDREVLPFPNVKR